MNVRGLLQLPVELQLDIVDLDASLLLKWPILCKNAAIAIRFDQNLNRQGKWEKYSKGNRILIRQAYFNKGVLVGQYKEFFEDGQLRVTCFYDNYGELHGEVTRWFSNGNMSERYSCIRGEIEGEYKSWYEDGQKKMYGCIIDGKREGEFISWRQYTGYEEDAQLKQESCFYVNGKLEGDHFRWFVSGALCEHNVYKNNKRHGVSRAWDDIGVGRYLVDERVYVDGLLEGQHKMWHRGGQLKGMCFYVKGRKEGEYVFWDEHGNTSDYLREIGSNRYYEFHSTWCRQTGTLDVFPFK